MTLILTEATDSVAAALLGSLQQRGIALHVEPKLESALAAITGDDEGLLIRGDLMDPYNLRLPQWIAGGLSWVALLEADNIGLALRCGQAGALDCFSVQALDRFEDWLTSHLQSSAPASPPKSTPKLSLASQPTRYPAPEGLIGECAAMQEVYERIYKAGPTRSTVLIRGDTGTGKELIAKAIHNHSDRKERPFVAVNCAAIPETLIESELFGHEKGSFTGAAAKRIGLIEEAEGGTLFLDEIGELPAEAQARLLRFIQESEVRSVGSNKSRKVDVRLIAATHRDLQAQSRSGEFRADLYYRINVFRIFLPLLRDRGDDIFLIAEHLLASAALKHDKSGLYLTPEAIAAIRQHAWEGNVRELENTIERAAIMTEGLAIDSHALEIDVGLHTAAQGSGSMSEAIAEPRPEPRTAAFKLDKAADDIIRSMHRHNEGVFLEEPIAGVSLEEYFQQFVIENQGHMNETELAKKLGISRKCLWERRQRFGIPREKAKESKENKGR